MRTRSFKLVSPSRLFVSPCSRIAGADVKHSNKSAGKSVAIVYKTQVANLNFAPGDNTEDFICIVTPMSAFLELAMESALCLFLSSRAVNTPSTLSRNMRVRKVEGGSKVYGKPVPNKLKSAKHCANDDQK